MPDIPETPHTKSLILNGDSEIYRFLVTYYQHQDRLSWSRTQIILVVEAAIVAAAFSKQGSLAVLGLVFGSVVIALVWCLIERDWEIRDQNLHLLDPIHEPLGIRIAVPPRIKYLSGGYIVRFLLGSILAFNFVAAICFACCCCCRIP